MSETARERIVAGNWKMQGGRSANATLLSHLRSEKLGTAQVVVFPPAPYLFEVASALSGSGIAWGAQDCSGQGPGAYTGEVAASMLAEFGCAFVIVGHSERRALHGETDAAVAAKAAQALAAGIRPIACVGETLSEREAGQTFAVVEAQLGAVVDRLGAELHRIVVAYEPVWAIGTGRTATPEQAQDVHARLRARLAAAATPSVPILYGGSVKADNAQELFAQPDVDGGLIGGASLNAADFAAICRAASR